MKSLFPFLITLLAFTAVLFSTRTAPSQPTAALIDIPPVSPGNSPVRASTQPSLHKLSLEYIFSSDKIPTEEYLGKKVTIAVTGDVLLARSVNFRTVSEKKFLWPFESTANLLQRADVALINLETPLLENCPLTNSGMIFCGDPRNVEGLLHAGIDVASLANNHSSNYGYDGLLRTNQILSEKGIRPFNHLGLTTIEKNGTTFAFLGFNDTFNTPGKLSEKTREELANLIYQAKRQSDVVIILFHWGNEYVTQPSPRQQELAHFSIQSGADLVLGNHAHWIQPAEIYQDKLILYSHGNFVFDQMWSQKTREGIIGLYTFLDKSLIDVSFVPIFIQDYGRPVIPDDELARQIIFSLKEASLNLEKSPPNP